MLKIGRPGWSNYGKASQISANFIDSIYSLLQLPILIKVDKQQRDVDILLLLQKIPGVSHRSMPA